MLKVVRKNKEMIAMELYGLIADVVTQLCLTLLK